VSGWRTSSVSVSFDGHFLDAKDFQAQVKEDDLLLWINRRIARETRVEIIEKEQ